MTRVSAVYWAGGFFLAEEEKPDDGSYRKDDASAPVSGPVMRASFFWPVNNVQLFCQLKIQQHKEEKKSSNEDVGHRCLE